MSNNQLTVIAIVLYIFAMFETQTSSEAAKILAYFPTPSISHQIVFRPLINELVKRGHDVTVITTDPQFPKDKAPANLTEIDVHDMSYDSITKIFSHKLLLEENKNNLLKSTTLFCDAVGDAFVKQIKYEAVRKAVFDDSQKYDLLILEAWWSDLLYVSHIHKVPTILVSSLGSTAPNLAAVGATTHISRQPIASQRQIRAENIWQKICVMFSWLAINIIQNYLVEDIRKYIRNLDSATPTSNELASNVDMLFLNVHPIWELNRPVPPNVIYLGGLHLNQLKELPPNLKSYMDSSKNGVIYVSFGTNVKSSILPSNVLQSLLKVFSKLPYDVIWRWTENELPGRSANIRIFKWLPQEDLLRHPKVKLFITQAGLQSTEEAINGGVPMIAIPVFADQWYNAELYVRYKIGLTLDILQINEENLLSAINNVIGNDSYRDNVAKLRSIMRDQMQSPLERAVWWTEYVIRHGGAKHLRSPLANLTWAEYLELDVVFLLLGISITSTLCFVILTCKTCKYIRRRFKKKMTLKKKQ